MAPTEATRWLTADEQRTWRAWLGINALLAATLDRQLQRDAAIPHAYYVTMAMLSAGVAGVKDRERKTSSSGSRVNPGWGR